MLTEQRLELIQRDQKADKANRAEPAIEQQACEPETVKVRGSGGGLRRDHFLNNKIRRRPCGSF